MMRSEPFSIQIEDDVLIDLKARIRNTRWPDPAPDVAWEQGTDLGYLKGLLAYWADGFDWRAQEHQLNAFAHFRADLDIKVHFIHERARGGNGIPLILTHGWPSSFVELLLQMYRALDSGLMCPSQPRTAANSTPTTMLAFAREVMAPMLAAKRESA